MSGLAFRTHSGRMQLTVSARLFIENLTCVVHCTAAYSRKGWTTTHLEQVVCSGLTAATKWNRGTSEIEAVLQKEEEMGRWPYDCGMLLIDDKRGSGIQPILRVCDVCVFSLLAFFRPNHYHQGVIVCIGSVHILCLPRTPQLFLHVT